MGRNVDMCLWFNAPETVSCKACGKEYETHFDDYDVDCAEPSDDEPGVWRLESCCPHCEAEQVTVIRCSAGPEVKPTDRETMLAMLAKHEPDPDDLAAIETELQRLDDVLDDSMSVRNWSDCVGALRGLRATLDAITRLRTK
jgi:hypothetical protein